MDINTTLEMLMGPLGMGVAGWIVVRTLRSMYMEKDSQLMTALQSQIEGLRSDSDACNKRVQVLLTEVLDIRKEFAISKKEGKIA